jgi:hypothetical protein
MVSKKLVETPMTPVEKKKPAKKSKKEEPLVEIVETPEHPVTGGKSPATLELIKKSIMDEMEANKKEKKEPTQKQLEARQRAKEKREVKKAEEEAAVKAAMEEARKKEEEIAARKAVQAEKRREKREGKKNAEIALQKPIDQTPSIQESVTIKKEPKKKLEIPAPGEHVFDPSLHHPPPPVVAREIFKPSSVSQSKRMGVWSVNSPTKRFR